MGTTTVIFQPEEVRGIRVVDGKASSWLEICTDCGTAIFFGDLEDLKEKILKAYDERG